MKNFWTKLVIVLLASTLMAFVTGMCARTAIENVTRDRYFTPDTGGESRSMERLAWIVVRACNDYSMQKASETNKSIDYQAYREQLDRDIAAKMVEWAKEISQAEHKKLDAEAEFQKLHGATIRGAFTKTFGVIWLAIFAVGILVVAVYRD